MIIKAFLDLEPSTVDNGGVGRGRSVAVGVSDRCDSWKVTCYTRARKVTQKIKINAKQIAKSAPKCRKVSKM